MACELRASDDTTYTSTLLSGCGVRSFTWQGS